MPTPVSPPTMATSARKRSLAATPSVDATITRFHTMAAKTGTPNPSPRPGNDAPNVDKSETACTATHTTMTIACVVAAAVRARRARHT
ncbi:MAG: hypothetical protein ACREQL_09440 [Candidatus Binatia bacterium]